jgi:hypothetical protein
MHPEGAEPMADFTRGQFSFSFMDQGNSSSAAACDSSTSSPPHNHVFAPIGGPNDPMSASKSDSSCNDKHSGVVERDTSLCLLAQGKPVLVLSRTTLGARDSEIGLVNDFLCNQSELTADPATRRLVFSSSMTRATLQFLIDQERYFMEIRRNRSTSACAQVRNTCGGQVIPIKIRQD